MNHMDKIIKEPEKKFRHRYYKKIIIPTLLLLALFVGGCSFKSWWREPSANNGEKGVQKKQNITAESACAGIGETPTSYDFTGKPQPGGKSCCQGLQEIIEKTAPSGDKKEACAYTQGGKRVCAPCGNGKCENQYQENSCNCAADCGQS